MRVFLVCCFAIFTCYFQGYSKPFFHHLTKDGYKVSLNLEIKDKKLLLSLTNSSNEDYEVFSHVKSEGIMHHDSFSLLVITSDSKTHWFELTGDRNASEIIMKKLKSMSSLEELIDVKFWNEKNVNKFSFKNGEEYTLICFYRWDNLKEEAEPSLLYCMSKSIKIKYDNGIVPVHDHK